MDISMAGLMGLCQILSENVVVARNANNFTLILFALVYATTKKGCYFAAFLLDLFLTNSIMLNSLTESQYYYVPVFIYSSLYWYIERDKPNIKVVSSLGLLIMFYMWVALDATINSETETFIYTQYSNITMFIYILIFTSLFPWKHIGLRVGGFARAVRDIIRYSDVVTYICYNYETNQSRPTKI